MEASSDAPPRTTPPCRASEPDPHIVPSSVWFGPFVPDSLERDFMAFLGAHNGVAVLTWPCDRVHAEHLARAGLPRLLLVPPATAPPTVEPLQDWLPRGASHAEVHRSLLTLSLAAAAQRVAAGPPTFDDEGRLHVGDTFVAIPPPERALAAILVTLFELPVTVTALTAAMTEPGGPPLQARLGQLGRRANVLGLEVVPRFGNAYMLRRCAHRPSAPNVANGSCATVRGAVPRRTLQRRPTLPMHFRSGLLAPNVP
jgi:hypothetical protein